jgi:thiaminase/transcriptional activator TenA
MSGFSEAAWQETAALRAAIGRLPFIAELTAGSLARARFETYITQDALYLAQFSRALTLAAAKAPDALLVRQFAHSAVGAVTVEQALHETYLRGFGVDPATVATAEPSPDCLAYTSFPLAAAHQEPWPVLVAALLPCFRIYWNVGCTIAADAAPDNPYRAWIDTYANPDFGASVERIDGDRRPCRRGDNPHRARPDARRLYPRQPIRMAVLGRRLPAARLAGVLLRRHPRSETTIWHLRERTR